MFKTDQLYQDDERWKDVKLGNSNETIGSWGGLLVSATMMLNGIGYNETPETVNEKMKKAGGFQGAFFIPSVLPYVWTNCAYRDMQPCENYPAPIAKIDAAVATGKPVILQVDWNKQAGIQTHFVLVKEKQGDDYVIYDTYKYIGDSQFREVLLTKRYKYNGATLEKEISAVLWFDSFNTAPPALPKVPLPADKYVLYAAEDDLALHAVPSTGYVWKRMTMGTELICLEPKTTAQVKLGVNGQWVPVQDPNGDQGYVAAWHVSDVKGQPPTTSATAPTSGSGEPLKVFLCHSSSDKPVARELCRKLAVKKNIDPWLDENKLLPGVDWNREIIQAIKASDVAIVCLSKASINKEGYVQKEIRHALDVAEEKPDEIIFLIPLRVEECEVPQKLRHLQWVNYYEDGAFDKLLSSLQRRAKSLGIEIE